MNAKTRTSPSPATAAEVNFDGLVGPTHNYAGLSAGNLASTAHRGRVSNPRAAALQGLAKARALADLGLAQAVLPPHPRPDVETLRRLGFSGSDEAVLRSAARQAPALLAACASASNMWVANAATVTPSADSGDGRVHFTPANLAAKLHRSLEPAQTARILRAIFRDETRFVVHPPVPAAQGLGDEGAANHTRFAPHAGARGLHLFVHGHSVFNFQGRLPRRFAPRQAREAFEAVARAHGLRVNDTVHARQHPEAIDAGVFHNDVISTGNDNVFLCHERAFADTSAVLARLRARYAALHRGGELLVVKVPEECVSLREVVRTYLFNSQLVTLPSGPMLLVAPEECARSPAVRDFLGELIASGRTPLREVRHFDLRESMHNGGGPACLRLRVTLTDAERATLPPGVFIDALSHAILVAWVRKHYRERISPGDLADPHLLEESRRALDELTGLLGLGSIYPFQTAGC